MSRSPPGILPPPLPLPMVLPGHIASFSLWALALPLLHSASARAPKEQMTTGTGANVGAAGSSFSSFFFFPAFVALSAAAAGRFAGGAAAGGASGRFWLVLAKQLSQRSTAETQLLQRVHGSGARLTCPLCGLSLEPSAVPASALWLPPEPEPLAAPASALWLPLEPEPLAVKPAWGWAAPPIVFEKSARVHSTP